MTYFSKQCDFTRKSVDSIQQAIPYSYRESSSRFTTLDWDLINLESNCWRKEKNAVWSTYKWSLWWWKRCTHIQRRLPVSLHKSHFFTWSIWRRSSSDVIFSPLCVICPPQRFLSHLAAVEISSEYFNSNFSQQQNSLVLFSSCLLLVLCFEEDHFHHSSISKHDPPSEPMFLAAPWGTSHICTGD